jgi:hypothetical protein
VDGGLRFEPKAEAKGGVEKRTQMDSGRVVLRFEATCGQRRELKNEPKWVWSGFGGGAGFFEKTNPIGSGKGHFALRTQGCMDGPIEKRNPNLRTRCLRKMSEKTKPIWALLSFWFLEIEKRPGPLRGGRF